MNLATTLLLLLVATLLGCAAAPVEEEEAAAGSSQAASRESTAEVATAFAIDYGASDSAAGFLVASGTFDSIDDRALSGALPDGEARAAARCIAARQDAVHGDTLAGLTWRHEHQTYYVLVVDLDDMQGLRDLHMLYVFAKDGSAVFQALTWDGKKNVKLAFGRSACPSPSR